jgi:hypothetical protein
MAIEYKLEALYLNKLSFMLKIKSVALFLFLHLGFETTSRHHDW